MSNRALFCLSLAIVGSLDGCKTRRQSVVKGEQDSFSSYYEACQSLGLTPQTPLNLMSGKEVVVYERQCPSGKPVPISNERAQEIRAQKKALRCANPGILDSISGHGTCVPGSRLVALDLPNAVKCLFIGRRLNPFDRWNEARDINGWCQATQSFDQTMAGETCFFQTDVTNEPIRMDLLPAPGSDWPWIFPPKQADCLSCHRNRALIGSAYLRPSLIFDDAVEDALPETWEDQDSPYHPVGGSDVFYSLQQQPMAYLKIPETESCWGCHRVANMQPDIFESFLEPKSVKWQQPLCNGELPEPVMPDGLSLTAQQRKKILDCIRYPDDPHCVWDGVIEP